MINNLNLEITKIINKKRKYIPQDVIESDLINLLILKYLCDTNIYTYKDIIKLNYIENREVKYESRTISFSEPEIKSLLPLIEYEDITSLVKDYLSALNIGINFIDSNEKKVCISADYTTNLYDPTGNTTYIINGFKQNIRRIIWFKFFDEVLKVNNEYIPYAELDITKYTKLYIHDFAPKYRFIRNSSTDLYDLIRNMIYRNKNLDIILHTPYKKISNMNEAWYLLSYLNTVILYDERDTYLIFKFRKSDNEDVSIINYDNFKDKTIKKLHEVIKNNRRQKDILTKTTASEIRKNYYRIGFKLYQNKLTEDISNINDIVDENTRLIERLTDLNSKIELEINKLINR